MSFNNLHFINHASFAVEGNESVLLIDPWYEGGAFNNGWSLLDGQTSNNQVIEWLIEKKKSLYIWYSHEHSDHFSISFLTALKNRKLKPVIFFQKTLDKRVVVFLRNQGFQVEEMSPGFGFAIDSNISITSWPYPGGDSFCLIKICDFTILNLNDCAVSSLEQVDRVLNDVKKIATSIDVLFTQFGYANWYGNESDASLRLDLANQKINRILLQEVYLKPKFIVPFASFVYFSNNDNFYLNDSQNSPKSLRNNPSLMPIQDKIFFMKPWDFFVLNSRNSPENQLRISSNIAIEHWENLKDKIKPFDFRIRKLPVNEIEAVCEYYQKKMNRSFVFLPFILELFGYFKPVKFLIIDLNIVVQVSYVRPIVKLDSVDSWDISLSSDVFHFLLKNEYGASTVSVNGRFRVKNLSNNSAIFKFFLPQELDKNGYGIAHPIISIKSIYSYLYNRARKNLIMTFQNICLK